MQTKEEKEFRERHTASGKYNQSPWTCEKTTNNISQENSHNTNLEDGVSKPISEGFTMSFLVVWWFDHKI